MTPFSLEKRIKVLLVDDHQCLLAGLVRLFENDSVIRIVGAVTCLTDAENKLVSERPDVVLLDLQLGDDVSGFSFVARAKELLPSVKIVVFSTWDDEIYRNHAESIGVNGYVAKGADMEVLKKAIRDSVRDGAASGSGPGPSAVLKTLSPSEAQVIRCLADGQSQKEAAVALGIAPSTVATHVQRAKEKMGVKSVFALFRLAGLVCVGHGEEA